jgi:hypothetical protein
MLVSSGAVAATTYASLGQSPKPDLGTWKLEPDAIHNGSFVVIKKGTKKKVKEYVKDLTYVDDGRLDGRCAGTVAVSGLVPITPWRSSNSEYWIVGSLKDMHSNFPTEIHVSATLNGKPLSDMTIAMLFSNSTTDSPSKTEGHLEMLSNADGPGTCGVVPYFEHG